MDKKTLYEKAEKAINQAFAATKKSVKVVSEKAGEAAHITRLLIEKATLEHQVSKKFAQIGNRVYEKVSREGKNVSASDQTIKTLIDETQKLDIELAQVEASLEKEKKEKKQSSRK